MLNATLLVATYLMLVKECEPEVAYARVEPLIRLSKIRHYKTEGEAVEDDIPISILHCLQGLKDFMELGLLNLDSIDVDE